MNTSVNHRTDNLDEYPITWENLVHGSEEFIPAPTFLIISQPMTDLQTTPIKEQPSPREKAKQNVDVSPKIKLHYRSRQLSSSSEGDSMLQQTEESLHNDERRSSDRKKPHRHSSTVNLLRRCFLPHPNHNSRTLG